MAVHDTALPPVKVSFRCGEQAFVNLEATCGVVIAPVDENPRRLIVSAAGAEDDLIRMALALRQHLHDCGLLEVYNMIAESDVPGTHTRRERVLGEDLYLSKPEGDTDEPTD